MKASRIVDCLLEWHDSARLEVMVLGEEGPFVFLRNGQPAGMIMSVRHDKPGVRYLAGMGTKQSLRKTGFGTAMLNWVFAHFPDLQTLELNSCAHGFYQKAGGKRGGGSGTGFAMTRSALKPSPWTFKEIPDNGMRPSLSSMMQQR